MNWKQMITIPLLGLVLGILLWFLFSPFLPGSREMFGGIGFGIALFQLPGLYFLLGIALTLSSLKISWWLQGIIVGAIFSLPPLYFFFSEFGEFGLSVIALWAFLFIISGGAVGFILEGVIKLLRYNLESHPHEGQKYNSET